MNHGLRTVGIIAAVVLLTFIIPTSSDVSQGELSAVVVIISPPSGLALPVGQAVEVRYHVIGAATVLELWSDGAVVAVDQVESGQEITHAWAPASPGPHRLTVRAFDEGSTLLATAERHVAGLPRGSPVRLRAER